MKEVFQKRKQVFRNQCLKYSRYVFNDHFVLFLLVFIGFLAVQYSQLLRNFPKNHLPIILALAVLLVFLLPLGRIATYMEKPDSLFLLVKEEELKSYLQKQMCSSYLLWSVFQTAILLLAAPLLLALGLPFWGWFMLVFFMLIAKWFLFLKKSQRFYQGAGINWSYLIDYEERRKQTILRFFALFTNVKGISNSVKRRAYLDGLTNILPKRQSTTWQNMFLRSYLRNGDFLALTMRLLFLSLLGIGLFDQSWIAAVFVILLNYLLLFQLTALYNAFDYQYLTFLFPLEIGLKLKGVRQVIVLVGYSVLLVETIMALLFFQDRVALLFMVGVTLLLYFFYLPVKLKSLVD